MARATSGDSGAGSVLVVGILAATLSLGALGAPLASVLVTKRTVDHAADAAALAAADTIVGRAAGVPCEVAARVAEANRGYLTACQADGLVVTVRVEATALGLAIGASATAGPPVSGS